MRRAIRFLLCAGLALGQDRQSEPVEKALQAYHHARQRGDPGEAAARREEARTRLAETPVNSPAFGDWVLSLQQLYENSGRHTQARAVVQDALTRASSLGDSHPVRILLLNRLADSWQSDGNLLQALTYREQAVAAMEATPSEVTQPASYPNPFQGKIVRSQWFSPQGSRFSGALMNKTAPYQQLAELYRQLGRPDAAAKALAKVRSLVQNDPSALAAVYESQGNLDEAAALYQKQAGQAAVKPGAQIWEVVGPLQSAASLYQREERWDEAAGALEQAASLSERSGATQAGNQATNIRLNLANLWQQAGRTQEADRVYQTLLTENSNEARAQVLQVYANHLSTTNRAAQAEDLLKSYLSDHPDLQPWQELGVLSALSRAAAGAGHPQLAEEYRRAASEKQSAMQTTQKSGPPLIGPDLDKARAAANAGHLDEGVSLASQAIASASVAQDADQIAWQVPSIASTLANKKAQDKGERLYQELFAQLQATSVDNLSPLLQARQQYVRFLIGQNNRWAEVPGVIERYRESVVAAFGADTSAFNQTILLRSEFALASGAHREAEHAAEQLLTHEASLSGVTSHSYMYAVQNAAGIFQSSEQPERALELRFQVIALADQTLSANDPERASARMNTANALIGVRRLDEAERLAAEAVAIAERLKGGQGEMFIRQLDQIRRMKAEARQPLERFR